MSWLTNVLNVIRGHSTEKTIATEPTLPADFAVGTSTSVLPATEIQILTVPSPRQLHRKWKVLVSRYADAESSLADRWGMLSAYYRDGVICRCLACRRGFANWDEGRNHDCENEKAFRRYTQRTIPRGGQASNPRSSSTPEGSPGDRPGIDADGLGLVASDQQPCASRGGDNIRREREPGRTGPSGPSSAPGSVRIPKPSAGLDRDRETNTKP